MSREKMTSTRWTVVATTILALVVTAGCGPATSTVSGTVTFNGEAVTNGSISLFPSDGRGVPAGGSIINGRYTVAKVAPGEKTVQLSAPVLAGSKKDDNGDDSKIYEDLIPPSWGRASQQKITVKAGAVTQDFAIEGPDPRKKK